MCVSGTLSLDVKQLGPGAIKRPFIPSDAEINEWSCTSFAPYAFVVCTGATLTSFPSLFLEAQLDMFSVNFCQLPVGRRCSILQALAHHTLPA